MNETTTSDRRTERSDQESGSVPSERPRTIWAALTLAPLAWAFHLVAAVSLVPAACEQGSELWLHLTTVVALPVAAIGVVLAVRVFRSLRHDPGNAAIGAAALSLAVISLGLIVVEELIILPLEPCA